MSHPSFPGKVIIWKEGILSGLDLPALLLYLGEKRNGLEVTGPLEIWSGVSESKKTESFAQELARYRIFKTDRPREGTAELPFPGEVRVEERMIGGITEPVGMLYDAGLLARAYSRAIGIGYTNDMLDPDLLHIIITYRLIGTFEKHDGRYHARTSYYAFPCIISTTGLVVAPAKPREYYFTKNLMGGGLSEEEILENIEGRYLDFDDERKTEVMKGYLLQALFYHATGNPFCEDPMCRLFNAHWQEDMLKAQLGGGKELCDSHEKMLTI
jgi:hypothetical protein